MEAEVGGAEAGGGGAEAGGGGAWLLEEAVHVDDGGAGNEQVEERAEGPQRRHGAAQGDRADPQVANAASRLGSRLHVMGELTVASSQEAEGELGADGGRLFGTAAHRPAEPSVFLRRLRHRLLERRRLPELPPPQRHPAARRPQGDAQTSGRQEVWAPPSLLLFLSLTSSSLTPLPPSCLPSSSSSSLLPFFLSPPFFSPPPHTSSIRSCWRSLLSELRVKPHPDQVVGKDQLISLVRVSGFLVGVWRVTAQVFLGFSLPIDPRLRIIRVIGRAGGAWPSS